MKYSALSAAFILAGAVSTVSGNAVPFDITARNYAPADRFRKSRASHKDIEARDISLETSLNLTTSYNFFITNITVGNPGQDLEVVFDTGSPFLWIFGQNGSFNDAPRFDQEKSTTYKALDQDFQALYGAGGVWGEWGSDDFKFESAGNYSIKNFPFGLVEQYKLAAGVPGLVGLGIGAELGAYNKSYQNVPEAFYEQNVTSSPAFSVYLDTADSGSVIFGGFDIAKVASPFYEYDIITGNSPGQATYYYQIQLNTLQVTGQEEYKVFGNAVLDTGSPFTQAPPGFVKQVGESLGFDYYAKYQCYYTNKTTEELMKTFDSKVTVSFTFGNFKVQVPIADMIVPGEYIWVEDGPTDASAIALLGAPQYVVGDHLFRNVYTILDSLNKKVYLARGKSSRNSHIVTLDSEKSQLPLVLKGSNNEGNPYSYSKLTTIPGDYATTSVATSAATAEATATNAALGLLELLQDGFDQVTN